MDNHFKDITTGGYMMGYTKTYTNITEEKKDIMYVVGAGEQDSFYIFYYDQDEEVYTLVATSFSNNFYFSPRTKTITYSQTGCCGESPLKGNIVLQFNEDGATAIENYAIVTLDIPESDIQPSELNNNPKTGVIENDDYNLRLYPSMENKYPDSDTFYNYFNDNLLGKIKKQSKVKIIGQRNAENRIWYYVEVDPDNLSINHTEGVTHNPSQNIRGWVSSNFVSLIPDLVK
ncbi:MAG: hypothetical protein LBI72_03310 [Flavobacteriaceae bacterium]|jgi:hypothetical protein|nr:hypothetical protein [Flavobacteriaceae bacterium]